ncbi:MAG: SPOR domain-containing protein [Vicingaceae bacterium]
MARSCVFLLSLIFIYSRYMRVSNLIILSLALFCQSCFAQNKVDDRKKEATMATDSTTATKVETEDSLKRDSLQPKRDTVARVLPPKKKKDSAEFKGLVLEMDERIDLLSKEYMSNKTLKGYKVQIFSGNSRWEASKVKSEFISAYPKLPTPDLIYHAPNFKLRVGNYRDRFEAEKNLRLLKEKFPSAFLVKDQINIEYKD